MSLPASTYANDLHRNYSFNTLDNRDFTRDKLAKNMPSLTVGSDTKSTSSRKQTFAELAEQLKNLLRMIRFPANIKSKE